MNRESILKLLVACVAAKHKDMGDDVGAVCREHVGAVGVLECQVLFPHKGCQRIAGALADAGTPLWSQLVLSGIRDRIRRLFRGVRWGINPREFHQNHGVGIGFVPSPLLHNDGVATDDFLTFVEQLLVPNFFSQLHHTWPGVEGHHGRESHYDQKEGEDDGFVASGAWVHRRLVLDVGEIARNR